MWHQFYRAVEQRLITLDFQQTVLLTLVVVAIGFFCMRGFGSRTNY